MDFSHFLVLKEYLCADLVLILLCSWEIPAERLLQTWECRSAAMGSSSSPLPVKDFSFLLLLFVMSAVFNDSRSTLPSLKVILVSISSLPS